MPGNSRIVGDVDPPPAGQHPLGLLQFDLDGRRPPDQRTLGLRQCLGTSEVGDVHRHQVGKAPSPLRPGGGVHEPLLSVRDFGLDRGRGDILAGRERDGRPLPNFHGIARPGADRPVNRGSNNWRRALPRAYFRNPHRPRPASRSRSLSQPGFKRMLVYRSVRLLARRDRHLRRIHRARHPGDRHLIRSALALAPRPLWGRNPDEGRTGHNGPAPTAATFLV